MAAGGGQRGGQEAGRGRQESQGGESPGQGWEVAEFTVRVSVVQGGKLANAPGRAVKPVSHSSCGLTGWPVWHPRNH